MDIAIVRLGHRIKRDIRITTHVILTGRALGAKKVYLSGEKDAALLERTRRTMKKWGGNTTLMYTEQWKRTIRQLQKKGYCILHATMYGEPIQKVEKKLRKQQKIAIVVGSEKVPAEMYRLSDYNIAVTQQPHSEVAALAIILDHLQRGKELEKKFSHAKVQIVPQVRGKKVVSN